MLESLLKNISEILKRNKSFFEENPELFLAVQERFEKAIEDDDPWEYDLRNDPYSDESSDEEPSYTDEDESWDEESTRNPTYQDVYDQDSNQSDEPSSEYDYSQQKEFSSPEDLEQERILNELEQKRAEAQPKVQPKAQPAAAKAPSKTDEDMYSDEAYDEATSKPKDERVSARTQWKPKESYAPHHSASIDNYIKQGYSHREAEALSNAHDRLSLQDALKRNVSPSEPSEKMMQMIQRHIPDIYADKKIQMSRNLNPEENPNLHFHSNKSDILKEAYMPFNDAVKSWKSGLKEQGKSDFEIDSMYPAFKKQWTVDNKKHVENQKLASNKIANIAKENQQAREGRRMEVATAAIMATKKDQESPFASGDTSGIAAGTASKEAARQSVGGFKEADDQPTQTATTRDPFYNVAAKNPELIRQLEQKVVKKLAPDQLSRLKTVQSVKKGST